METHAPESAEGRRTGSQERAVKPSPMRAPPPRTGEKALPQTASRSPEVGQSQSPLRGSHNPGWDSLQGPHFHPPSPPEDSPLSPRGAPDTGSDAPAAQTVGPRWLGPRSGAGAVLPAQAPHRKSAASSASESSANQVPPRPGSARPEARRARAPERVAEAPAWPRRFLARCWSPF